jgi:hypothetical protein
MDSNNYTELQLLSKSNKHQLSDLYFLNDEVRFLKSLLDTHFLSMIRDSFINRIQLINTQLTLLDMIKANVTKEVLIHQGNINSATNGLQSKSMDLLKLENDRVEDEIEDLNKCFKNIKKEIFLVYKEIINNEPQKANILA